MLLVVSQANIKSELFSKYIYITMNSVLFIVIFCTLWPNTLRIHSYADSPVQYYSPITVLLHSSEHVQ